MDGSSRVSTVILVDARGWLLLQERDASAPVAPNQWGLVGGHVESDEDFESAVYRELAEETGLHWESGLSIWFDGHFHHSGEELATRFQVWVAPTKIANADIVVCEGRQIVFVDPTTLDNLDLGESAGHFVRELLNSPVYPTLVRLAGALT